MKPTAVTYSAVCLAAVLITSASQAASPEPSKEGTKTPGAAGPSSHSPGAVYQLNAAVELPILITGAAIMASWMLSNETPPPHCAPDCSSQKHRLPFIDKPATGNWSDGWHSASDVGVVGAYGVALLGMVSHGDFVDNVNDFVVIAEAAVLSNTIAVVVQGSTRRPRPYMYGGNAPLETRYQGTSGYSFFSGHTSTVFAATAATFSTLHRKYPEAAWPWWFFGGGLAVSSFTGITRVLAGRHFPTDVLAGALVGTSTGFFIPAIHPKKRKATTYQLAPVTGQGMRGVALSGSF